MKNAKRVISFFLCFALLLSTAAIGAGLFVTEVSASQEDNVPPYWGDVNGDGLADFSDELLINEYRNGNTVFTDEQKCFADVDFDGDADFDDMLLINKFRLDKISSFPAQNSAAIVINKYPEKTTYKKGEQLILDGFELLIYNNESTDEIYYTFKQGFTVSGYDSSKPGSQRITVTFRGLRFYFTVTVEDAYNLTFRSNMGSGVPEPLTGSTTYTIPAQYPSCFGYDFSGWYYTEESGHLTYYDPGDEITLSKDTTLDASWGRTGFARAGTTACQHFKYPGQKQYIYFTPETTADYVCYSRYNPEAKVTLYDEEGNIITNATPTSGNFRLKYRLQAGTKYYYGVSYTDKTKTGYVYVSMGPVYTVQYHENGGSNAPATQYKDWGKKITLSSSEPVRKDYIFVGWSTSSNAQTVDYYPGDTYDLEDNLSLYAVWKTDECQHNKTHTENENEVSPTCTEDGSYDVVTYCSDCGVRLSKETKTVKTEGHSLEYHEGMPSTCKQKGYKAYETCSKCDYSTYEELPLAPHDPTVLLIENEVVATCTEQGSYDSVIYCSVCETEIKRTTVTHSALGHSFTNYNYNNDATTESDGTETAKCDRCNATNTRTAEGTKISNTLVDAQIFTGASRTVDYRSKVTVTATAENVSDGYYLAIYEGNNLCAKGNNVSVSYYAGEMKSDKLFTAKIVDKDGNPAGDNLQKDVKVTVKTGFFDKLVAFFKGLFNSLPTVEIKP